MSATITFTGFAPEHPEGRFFDLWRLVVPGKNKREDQTDDLKRFIYCMQEIAELLLVQIDRFVDLFDPDICSDETIDLMLEDMGNPFTWAELDLTPIQRRKLLRFLVEIYKSKGTAPGIENTVLFLLGEVVTVVPYLAGGWVLGVDELGDGSIAQVGCLHVDPYDFNSLTPPWTMSWSVDEGPAQIVTFVPGDFADPANGTAAEVVAVLVAQLVGASAYEVADGAPAFLIGGTATFNLVGGEALWVRVNGVDYEMIFHADDFTTPGAATMAEVLTAMHEQIPGLEAIEDVSGGLGLYTLLTGSSATIEIPNIPENTAAVPLGFSLGASDVGLDGNRFYVYSETAGPGASIECTSVGNAVDGIIGFWPRPAFSTGGSVLAPTNQRALYSFDIETAQEVDAETEDLIRKIGDYMRCAHEHLIDIRTAPPLPWPDGWQLGVDQLGVDTELAP